MPQLNRMYCSKCKKSIFLVEIDGVRVPLVHYIVTGQPQDTGPAFDGKTAKLTSFTRESLQMPMQRIELCEVCFAELLGLKLLSADDDPMYSDEQAVATAQAISEIRDDAAVEEVERHAQIAERALHALKVGRGAAKAPKLPNKKEKAVEPRIA